MAASSSLGGLGGLVKGLRRGKKLQEKPGPEGFSAGRILAAHKDNFSISYGEVVNVVVAEPDDPTGVTRISLLTERDKLTFTSQVSPGRVAEVFRKGLAEKLMIQRGKKIPHP